MSPSIRETVAIAAPAWAVWESLTRIECMQAWMGEPEMRIEVETGWNVGGAFVVRGHHHEPFVNTGVVLAFEPQKALAYTHLSSSSQLPDLPQNHTVFEFALDADDDHTVLTMVATGFPTPVIFKHLQFYWAGTLDILKRHAERYARHTVPDACSPSQAAR